MLNGQEIRKSVNSINYSIADGLPSAETYDIFQDSKGFIWIGTDNGAVKYDGANFKTYTTKDGLTDNTIFKFHEDKKGRLWFLTYNRRLCYLKDDIFYTYKFNIQLDSATKKLAYNQIISEFEIDDKDNISLWFQSIPTAPQHGLNISNTGKSIKTTRNKNYRQQISAIQFAENNLEKFQNLALLFKNKPNNFSIVIRTDGRQHLRLLKHNKRFLIGQSDGLYFYDYENDKITDHFLKNVYITSIWVDFENGIWCSSLFNGVYYIPSPQISNYKLPLTKNVSINGIIPQDDHLFFSFNKDVGNFWINPRNNMELAPHMVSLKKFPSTFINQGIKLENPVEAKEIFSDLTSLIYLTDTTFLFTSAHRNVLYATFHEKEPDTLSSPTEYFLNYYQEKFFRLNDGHLGKVSGQWTFNSKDFAPNTPRVLRLFRLNQEIVLMATLNGLYEYNLKSKTVQKSKILGVNDLTRVQDIARTPDGTLFFATKGKGIKAIHQEKDFEITLEMDGSIASINQLLYDENSNRFFASTNLGVFELFRENDLWSFSSVISKYDGLDLSDIRQIRIKNGILYFANNTGVGKVDLQDIPNKLFPPKLYINSFRTGNQSYNLKSKIKLPFDSNNFEISYQGIAPKSQNNFTYYYRLDQNAPWRTTTNSALTFNGLDPDVYHFEIKAANIYGVESTIQSLKFEILTPYWQTWWFISLIVILFLTLLSYLIFRIVAFYKNKTAIQRKLNELQVLSLQSKMSPHFIFNSLNSIQNYILTNNKLEANEYLIDFSRLIRTILKNSEKSTILLSNELEILNMYVELEKRRLRKPFTYLVEIKGEINLTNCVIPSLLMQPYVENSIWHGQVYNNPEGEIKFIIERKDNSLFITISDNGIGIKKARELKKENNPNHKSIGAETTKNRIELISELNEQMSEVITEETNTNSPNLEFVGTTIKFSIPYI